MKNNKYDFKMEWPEEFSEFAEKTDGHEERTERIMTAIQPVIKKLRFQHRSKLALRYGALSLSFIGCTCLIVSIISKNTIIDQPGLAQQVKGAPVETAVIRVDLPVQSKKDVVPVVAITRAARKSTLTTHKAPTAEDEHNLYEGRHPNPGGLAKVPVGGSAEAVIYEDAVPTTRTIND